MRSLRTLPVLFLVTSCGGEPPPSPTAPPQPPVTSAPPKTEAPKVQFENPGGMWMPHQLAAHKETLKALGLEIDPAALTDPTSSVLGAVVSLGGCSASFVSADGLLATNHHCVTGALQYNSTPQQNLLKDGFLAKTRADEKWNGPTAKVWVTLKVSEVTDQVLAGIDKVKDDQARYKAIEAKQKELVAACEKGRPTMRCSVARFFEGERFYQIEQLELRDIRLVYAPAAGIGNYGGEIDNWRWPRHTGDVSFYRAYVGKDGQPADHAADNVPYKPQHVLKIASKPLAEGDLVYVAGYPARTSTLKTKAEVDEAVTFFYPRRQAECEDYLKVLHALAEKDKEVGIKATPMIRGFGNRLTNTKGQLDGLVKGGLAAQKGKQEADLAAWIEVDPQRKATYGGVLEEIGKAHAEAVKHAEEDADLRELAGAAKLVSAASIIVRMAEERAKPDAERHPDYQERNWKRLEQSQIALSKAYHRTLDTSLLKLAQERISKHAKGAELVKLLGKDIDALFKTTKLEDEKRRVELLNKATTADLKKSTDPIIKLAVALRPLLKAAEDRDEAYAGKMALLKPRYIKALREHTGKDIAPDANGTLRVSYGTVRGYKPTPDAPMYRPFTVLSEVVAKAKDTEPFLAPQKLLEAARAKKVGPYVDAKLGEVPVDFLADLHITGGNSGSATLNAKGELTGLVFDGNYEAMASDWLFIPSITRSIHVDIRYILWVMDAVDGADHLVKEMGATPAID
jgi:hypothetical protein